MIKKTNVKNLRILILGIAVCAVATFFLLRPAPQIDVGLAKAVPSSLVNTEPTDVTFSISVSERYGARVERVVIDLSDITGESKAQEMTRADHTWSLSRNLGKGLPHGTYPANISIINKTGAVETVRKVKLHVLPESGSGCVSADDPYYRYQGRVTGRGTDSPSLVWPGNSVEARFRGTSVSARFDNSDSNVIFYAIIDRDYENPIQIRLETGDQTHAIVTNLKDDWHEVKLHRITETRYKCGVNFKGLILDEGCGILPPQDLSGRKMEFYGDSITSGAHAEKGRHEGDENARDNNYVSYGALIARAFDAEYSCIARDGIALTSSYHPGEAKMVDFYKRSIPCADEPTWDFSTWQADVVVVNLLTNDDWFWGNLPNASDIPSDEWFKVQYKKFLSALRKRYPEAHIFGVLGTMPSVADWPPPNPDMVWVIEKSVKELNEDGDDKFYSLMFDYQHPDPGHPSAWHHKHLIADKLIPVIKEKLGW